MVAEPPRYQARKITSYTQDDGQELSELAWTPDASAIVYVRVDDANRAGEYPNPALDPQGAEQDLWIVGLDGSAPRQIGEGHSPAVSPNGDRVAFIRRGQIWWAPLDAKSAPALRRLLQRLLHNPAVKGRGECARPVWSPDGARLAFENNRGDHGFIGVFDVAAGALRYLDPGTDFDGQPEWSPDSRSVAFVRIPSTGHARGASRHAARGEPWSIRVASAETARAARSGAPAQAPAASSAK